MSIYGVLEAIQNGYTSGDRSLVFRADSDFSSTLTMGQILKGKVLRHYEGSRYSLSFGGREQVVDSAIPLQVGEMIRGRVVGLNEKVHLQRIGGVEQPLEGIELNPKKQHALNSAGANNKDTIATLFSRYQVTLTPIQHSALKKLEARLGDSKSVALSALILSKLGLPLEASFIEAIHRVLEPSASKQELSARKEPSANKREPSANKREPSADIKNHASVLKELLEQQNELILPRSVGSETNKSTIQALASQLAHFTDRTEVSGWQALASRSLSENRPSQGSEPSQEDARGGNRSFLKQWSLGQWLLNVQNEGSTAHRFFTFPLWLERGDGLGKTLVEVSLALFSQKQSQPKSMSQGNSDPQGNEEEPLSCRKAVFALDTENLGHVQVEALAVNRHLRLEVIGQNQSVTELLAQHLNPLTTFLKGYGWQVDEVRYQAGKPEGVKEAVVEHYVTPDSLSCLM